MDTWETETLPWYRHLRTLVVVPRTKEQLIYYVQYSTVQYLCASLTYDYTTYLTQASTGTLSDDIPPARFPTNLTE